LRASRQLLGLAALLGAAVLVAMLLWWRWPRAVAPAEVAERAAPLAAAALAASPPATLTPVASGDTPVFTPDQLRAEPSSREWLVRWLADATRVLVIEFPDLQTQGRALNRVAALIEKRGASRERVLDDAGLQALIQSSGDTTASFFLGHDYRATDLARFYTLAAAQRIALDADEQQLRDRLLHTRLLTETEPGRYTGAVPGALVTFSAADAGTSARPDERIDVLRRASVMEHELSHGRFFTDAAYREHCAFFWHELLSEPEREAWRRYLAEQGYDRGNEELMINETQALLMHTPDTRDFNAAALHWTPADLQGLRERFRLGLTR